ncbi:MAG: choice-of-anchor Q domain-containing protein, partial [Bacteroidota bacterium]
SSVTLLMLFLLLPSCLSALTVLNTNDSGAGSFREAVALTPAGGTVNFDASLSGATITLTTGVINIAKNLTIEWTGSGDVTLDGDNNQQILTIAAGAIVTINNLEFIDGFLGFGSGAAIENLGTLTVQNCSFTGCSTGLGNGGAIYNRDGALTLNTCDFTNNTAPDGGAVASFQSAGTASLIINGGTYSGNRATGTLGSGEGGAVLIEGGSGNLSNFLMSSNLAEFGGAIYATSTTNLSIANATFNTNRVEDAGSAINQGGALFLEDLNATLSFISFNTNQSQEQAGAIYLTKTAGSFSTSFTNIAFSGNIAGSSAGAVYTDGVDLTITNTPFSNNSGSFGGGLYMTAATVGITRGSFSGNNASAFGGGIFNSGGTLTADGTRFSTNDGASRGGGIANSAGTVTLDDCLLSANTGGSGAGIYNIATALTNGILTLTNCTLSGNQAGVGSSGGGIHNLSGTLTLTSSTLTLNSAQDGGGVFLETGSLTPTMTLDHAVIAGNTAVGLGQDGYNPSGTLTSNDYNFIGDNDDLGLTLSANDWAGSSSGSGVLDAQLGSLQDNGGDTHTHLPACGSPLIDSGNSASAPATDQRGQARPGFSQADRGAVEVQAADIGSATTHTVTSIANTGAGSLRRTVLNACPDDLIDFDPSLSGSTFALASEIVLNKDVEIQGLATSQIFLNGGSANRIFNVDFGTTARISQLTIQQGFDGLQGGGLINFGTLELIEVLLLANNAGSQGGAIYNQGNLTVTNSTFLANGATTAGGAVYNDANPMNMTGCAVVSNTATNGAIFNLSSNVDLINNTLSGNTVTNLGGAVYHDGGNLLISSCTITQNTAVDAGGLFMTGVSSNVTFQNSVLSNNAGLNPDGVRPSGALNSLGYNLVGNTVGLAWPPAVGDQLGVLPLLDPLAMNGGPTLTHAPQFGSPVIDFGNSGLALDQRGYVRPAGSADDIGAVESSSVPFPVEWTSLDAYWTSPVQAQAAIRWETAREVGADYFAVEKSLDGRLFTEVGRVQAKGNEQAGAAYQLFDMTPAIGLNIYRIRQVDKDGVFAFSDLMRLEKTELSPALEFRLGPIPVDKQVQVFLEGTWTFPVEGRLIDMMGREMETFTLQTPADLQVNGVEFLSPGRYFMQLNQQNLWISRSFTKY